MHPLPTTIQFFVSFTLYSCSSLLQAYEHGIRYPQYLFLFYGWYSDNWWVGTESEQKDISERYPGCTVKQRESVVPYSLAPLQAEFLMNESIEIDSGIVSYTMMVREN